MNKEIQHVNSTLSHIREVQGYLQKCVGILMARATDHDASKFSEEEWPIFLEHTAQLKTLTYGSAEYKQALAEMKPALDHHYAENRHHPEHFARYECNGCFTKYLLEPSVCGQCGCSQFTVRSDMTAMNLLDLLEMACDWLAATHRHADGDIARSIEQNQERFGYTDELKSILKNTVTILERDTK